ncbi:MAG: transglycosylase SLT domain-containing protein [Polymorphobacter sp.]
MGTGAAIGGLTRQGGAAAAAQIAASVRNAAARTGTDFGYLMAQARVESGLNPTAKAATSSARGLYQFTNATWLDTVRKHGAEHGLGWAADAIAGGAARAGSAARATILSLRDNAEAAALMAGEFAQDNAEVLERKLGRAVGATDLYMAHFLGAGGAAKFLAALATAPGMAAAALLPAAAAANRGVFYARDGAARSVGEVYARFGAKLGVPLTPHSASALSRPLPELEMTPSRRRERVVTPLPLGQVAESTSPAAVGDAFASTGEVRGDRARLAYMLLAELGG